MHFVDDVYPVFGGGRSKIDFVPDFPDVVDAVVRGRVDLLDVENGPLVYPAADFAFVAGFAVLWMQAVDGLCQAFRTGGLSGSARAGENIGMGYFTGPDRVFQGRCNRLLP